MGPKPPSPSPVLVDGIDQVVEIAAGEIVDCARRTDGSVWCWGDATGGQPQKIEGATFSSIVAGAGSACGIASGGVACLGAPFLAGSQCNIPLKGWSATATGVPFLAGIAGVSLGQWFACAFDTSGATSCWGCAGGPPPESHWILGSMTPSTPTPIPVPGVVTTVRIAAETDSTCAVQANGDTICWGDQSQFGKGITVHPVGPEVADLPKFPLDIDVGVTFTCAAYPDEVRCVGGRPTFADGCKNVDDSLGSFSLPGIVELSVGFQHLCARDGGGAVWCWGCNQLSEVGDGTKTPRATPVRVL